MATPLYTRLDFDEKNLVPVVDAIAEIALGELGLDVYDNEYRVISVSQMLDAYAGTGLPKGYAHWSHALERARLQKQYDAGKMGLAYELVINSNPCISYNMENNNMHIHTLVAAHAAFGHNHFFKNNYLFLEHTDAHGLLAFLENAQAFIDTCYRRHGKLAELTLDAAHALRDSNMATFWSKVLPDITDKDIQERIAARARLNEEGYDDFWDTVAPVPVRTSNNAGSMRRNHFLPEENVLHFIRRHSPVLAEWQREMLHIVQRIAQYFHPQRQTKVMNEGCATFTHYYVMQRLEQKGLLPKGALLQMLGLHANVVNQSWMPILPPQYTNGVPNVLNPMMQFNPYRLGFEISKEILRIAYGAAYYRDPVFADEFDKISTPEQLAEDAACYPRLVGQDPYEALRFAWANYRDDTFIAQYLSPRLMRDMRLFTYLFDEQRGEGEVLAIHNSKGYDAVRAGLSSMYTWADILPDIQVTNADMLGDRKLTLTHNRKNGRRLREAGVSEVLDHVAFLWGGADGETPRYAIRLEAVGE